MKKKTTLRSLWTVHLIIVLSIITLFANCKSKNMDNENVRLFAENYIAENYPDDQFDITKIEKVQPRFESVRSYTLYINSKKYPRHQWVMIVDPEMSIKKNGYINLLMEEAYYKQVDFDNYEDFPNVFNVQLLGYQDLAKDIKNIDDATKILSNENIGTWFETLHLVVDDHEEQVYEIEDMIINYGNIINKAIGGEHEFRTLLYPSDKVSVNDLNPDMNLPRMNRIPEEEKLIETWSVEYNRKDVESHGLGMQSLVKKRKVIPNF